MFKKSENIAKPKKINKKKDIKNMLKSEIFRATPKMS